ncbi:unnamed protein product [Chrysoparadoxa australica]
MFGDEAASGGVLEDEGVAVMEVDSSISMAGDKALSMGAKDVVVSCASSDVIVFNVLQQDLHRAGALSELMPALEEALALSEDALEEGPKKKELIIVVRDFDGDSSEEAALAGSALATLEGMWESAARPEAATGAKLADYFTVQMEYLPHHTLASSAFSSAAAALKRRLLASSPQAAAGVLERLQKMSALAGPDVSAPSAKEMKAAAVGGKAVEQCFASYTNLVLGLSKAFPGLDEEFGEHQDDIAEDVMAEFKDLCSGVGGSVVGKKRKELMSAMARDASARYAEQLALLKAAATGKFRQELANVRVGPGLGKEMSNALEVADKYFRSTAPALKCKLVQDSSQSERKALITDLREFADERLQLAKLQGATQSSNRLFSRPVALNFHWLLPKPFGTDARQSILSVDDKAAFASTNVRADAMFFEFAPTGEEIEGPPTVRGVYDSHEFSSIQVRKCPYESHDS